MGFAPGRFRRALIVSSDIRDLIPRLDPVRIIPTCEEVFHLTALAEADGFSERLFAPPPDRLATLHAKDRFAGLCRRLSLPVPDTELVADRAARLRLMADTLAGFAGTGQIACDAIIDADGQPWLIECNPRATSGVHLFGRGAAFGRALLGRGEAEHVAGARHLSPALWLHGLPTALRDRRFAGWRTQRRHGSDAVAAPGDGLPVLGALLDAAVFGLRAVRLRRSLTEAMTADIEWNGRPLDPG